MMLPESVMYSGPFLVLATFVATNTMMYAVLAIAKLAPKVYVADLVRRRDQRVDNRSIYPDGPASAPDAGEGWWTTPAELRAG